MKLITSLKQRLAVAFAPVSAGFTLIEMLIVVTVLAILAVLIISALNPIEQINRSRDTTSRSDAGQLAGAIERYYAFNSFYPWQTDAEDTDDLALAWTEFAVAVEDDDECPITEKLSAGGEGCLGSDELRETFIERITGANYNPLFVHRAAGAASTTYVCFAPQSAAFIAEASARADGTLPDDYPDSGTTQAVGNTTDCGTGGDCTCLP